MKLSGNSRWRSVCKTIAFGSSMLSAASCIALVLWNFPFIFITLNMKSSLGLNNAVATPALYINLQTTGPYGEKYLKVEDGTEVVWVVESQPNAKIFSLAKFSCSTTSFSLIDKNSVYLTDKLISPQ